MRLTDEGISFEEVLKHPRHQAAQAVMGELIGQLRACANVKDGYEFQQSLLSSVLTVEADRNAFSQAVKRMRGGRAPQAGAPEPQSGLDPSLLRTWELELGMCERVARQYRCVGDALAWCVFGFQRRYILALCRNQPPGVMAGKKGLEAERARVEQAWKEDGQFALMHDLTHCLRIGDLTVFSDDPPQIVEVKTNPQRHGSAQNRRIREARLALSGAGPLSGDDPGERLYDLDVPFKTYLHLLATGIERAIRDGIFAAKMPGARALLVTDLHGCQAQGWTEEEFIERLERQITAALRRAGLGPRQMSNIHSTSLDSVSRDPLRVPFAAYPLHPVACARLIGDVTTFMVETSGPALAEMLCEAGISARWVRTRTGDLMPREVIMEMVTKNSTLLRNGQIMETSRTLQMSRSELDKYLIELIEQGTWIEGIRFLQANRRTAGRPWPCYRDEHRVWM